MRMCLLPYLQACSMPMEMLYSAQNWSLLVLQCQFPCMPFIAQSICCKQLYRLPVVHGARMCRLLEASSSWLGA